MNTYPITTATLNKEDWNRRTNSTLMMSFPAEQQTLPILHQIVQLLTRLADLPLEETLVGKEVHEYFLTNVFPIVCQKLISSKYFRNDQVLLLSNTIMETCVAIYNKYPEFVDEYPKWAELLVIVFDPEAQYFRSNNQLENKHYPWQYYSTTTVNAWAETLDVGDFIDALKFDNTAKKATWSRGQIALISHGVFEIQFTNDTREYTRDIPIHSLEIAPFKSKSLDFQWRLALQPGDLVDCCDTYGMWYNATVLAAKSAHNNGRILKIGFRVYDPNGEKEDHKGKYVGLSDSFDQENIDATSPKIQPFNKIAKPREYSVNKHQADYINDFNDYQFDQVNGEEITFIPRAKFLSGFLFRVVRNFIKNGGYQLLMLKVQEKPNVNLLVPLVSSLGNIAPNLHKNYLKKLIERLKPIIHKHLFDESQQTQKQMTKEKSEFIFTGMKHLIKRILSLQQYKEYQNSEKLDLALICLNSDTLKRRLQGMAELKDILRTYRIHLSSKLEDVSNWLKKNKIFEKIYVNNSHVQLIKRSAEFFRFLINENMLELDELALIYKAAQKGDYESKISLYKLFEQVSHNFKKNHVDFLIDQILESEICLISSQDIDLLHELSRYSNYFPLQKVMAYFEKIIFSDSPSPQLLQASIKKYTQIVNRNYDMRLFRKDIVVKFVDKMATDNLQIIIKVLTNIFENVTSGGECGKYELLQVLQNQEIDSVLLASIKRYKSTAVLPVYLSILEKSLNFLTFIVNASTRVHVSMDNFIEFWNVLIKQALSVQQKQLYYKWCSEICKGDNLSESRSGKSKFEDFFLMLTSTEQLSTLNEKGFEIIKHLFLDINKKEYKIGVSSVWKNSKECKVYKVKTTIEKLKFYNKLIEIIYSVHDNHIAELALELFNVLYANQEMSADQRKQYFHAVLGDFFEFSKQKQFEKVVRNLKIIEYIIDESEKEGSGTLKSLSTMRKGQQLTLQIMNQTTYLPDNLRKFDFKTSSNTTLFELRKALGYQLSIHWQQLRITQKEQLSELLNSKTIKELKIKLNECLTLTKKPSYLITEEHLLLGNKLNPKCAKALTNVFNRYSTNGKMNRQQCRQFIGLCVGDMSKQYQERLNSIFKKYDSDKDDILVAQNILDFYEESAREKPSIVWNNLHNCGIRNDFKCADDPDEEVPTETLPRYELSINQNFYQALFSLLDQEDRVAKATWLLLERLPISKTLYNSVISLKEDNPWDMLDLESPYKTIYTLYVFEYLTDSQEEQLLENQRLWKQSFIKMNGYEYLFDLFQKIMNKEKLKGVDKNIIEFIFKMITKYLVQCFADLKSAQAYTILANQLQFQEIINYLKCQQLPKTVKDQTKMKQYSKLVNPQPVKTGSTWNGKPRTHLLKVVLEFVLKLWTETKNQIQRDSQLDNCFNILLALLFNGDIDVLLNNVGMLLETAPSTSIAQKLYKLLIGLCLSPCNTKPIIDTLFKMLRSKTVSSEFFKTIALLVSKYGLSDANDQIPSLLINSIMKSDNERTIQGCAHLLSQIPIKQIDTQTLNQLWTRCLFSRDISCKSQNTREVVYQLLISLSTNNPECSSQLIKLTLDTLEHVDKSKVLSPNDILNRSAYNYAGIKNIGNICYMLAMIQQFYLNPTFRYLMLRIDDKQQPQLKTFNNRQIDDNLLHQFRRMFAYLEKTQRENFVPNDFCFSFKDFTGEPVNVTIQQDAQEFISMIFDKLQKSIKDTPFKHILDNIYGGKVSNLLTCDKCNKVKIRQQNFYSLSVQVKNSKTLAQSFNKLILGEIINEYKCDFCNQKADVTKKTAISKSPNTLIIHLQRLVFNFDTFLNEKINTKLQFPMEFNLLPYSLATLNNQENVNSEDYEYSLRGVVAHYGTAEFGHYYSFIKTNPTQWLEFNDSKVFAFDVKNIETECFGGQSDLIIEDQFDIGKKENSKNAYILIYQKKHKGTVQLEFSTVQQKQRLLKQLSLFEKVKQQQQKIVKFEEDEEQQQIREDQPTMYRKLSRDYKEVDIEKPELNPDFKQDLQLVIQQQKPQQQKKQEKIIIDLEDQILQYFPAEYETQILQDNLMHQFEVNICSASFLKFYNDLLKLPSIPKEQCPKLIEFTQKLAFGIWLKNPFLKQILIGLQTAIKSDPRAALPILKSESIYNMLIESSDVEMRTSISNLLSGCVGALIKLQNLQLTKANELDTAVVNYLDNLFSQLPTTVAKNWMKFGQYFDFWKTFAEQGSVQFNYLMRKQTISHFIDYFLEKKSPLQIYANKKHVFGNRYTQPNFTSLFATVSFLVTNVLKENPDALSKNDRIMLLDFNFLDKLIVENNQIFVNKIVLSTAVNNLYASERIALVLLKGLHKSSYETVQPFLEVMNTFLLINDDLKQYRCKWVLGNPTLVISTITKTLSAFNSYTTEERLYIYESSIQYDLAASLLEPLYKSNNRAQNFCCMCLKALLLLCQKDEYIFNFVYNLPPPNLNYAKYFDFWKDFVDTYVQESKRYSYAGFPREEFGKMTKQLLNKFLEKVESRKQSTKVVAKEEQKQQQPQNFPEQQKIEIPIEEQPEKLQIDIEEQKICAPSGIAQIVQQNKKKVQHQQYEHQQTDSSKNNRERRASQQSFDDEEITERLKNIETQDLSPKPVQVGANHQGFDDEQITEQLKNIETQGIVPKPVQIEGQIEEEWEDYSGILPQNTHLNESDKDTPIKKFNAPDELDAQEITSHSDPYVTEPVITITNVEEVQLENLPSAVQQTKQQQQNKTEPLPDLEPDTSQVWHPCSFKYNLIYSDNVKGLIVSFHESELTFIKTRPEGKRNSTFPGAFQKLASRIPEQCLASARKQIIKGFYIYNSTRDYMRVKWQYGTSLLKSSDSIFIWAEQIDKVWVTDREMDWPKWSMFQPK